MLLVAAAGCFGYIFFKESELFRVRRITVQGCRMTNEAQVLAAAEIRQGIPLFGFDLPAAEQRIARLPWIDRASISRSWPCDIRIRVHECRPLAMITLEKKKSELYYVDSGGRIFAPVEPGQDLDFPVITGFAPPAGAAAGGNLLQDESGTNALEFLRAAALGHPMLPMQSVSEVHLLGAKGIVVYLAEQPFPIYMGYGNITARYYQLVKLLERLYRGEKIENIREIRMDYQPGRILVAKLKP